MALLIYNQSRCPLCSAVITREDDLVMTTAFIHDRDDILWPYADAAMHAACFKEWPFRDRFVATYNAAAERAGLPSHMNPDGRLLITHLSLAPDQHIADELAAFCRPLARAIEAGTPAPPENEHQTLYFSAKRASDPKDAPAFSFTYHCPDGNDYTFHRTAEQVIALANGDTPTISLEFSRRSTRSLHEPD